MDANRPAAPGPNASSLFDEQMRSTREVAALFRTSEKTIRDWIKRGDLPGIRFGKAWYISESALRASKEMKEEQARSEMLKRRRQSDLMIELARKQQREPQMSWELTDCIGCDNDQVFSSKHARDEGTRLLCDSCKSADQALSREAIERRVIVQVRERNRRVQEDAAETQRLYEERPRRVYPPWQVYHCAKCGYPQPLSLDELKRRDFYPWCDGCEPEHDFGEVRVPANMNPSIISALAWIEASERNSAEGGEFEDEGPWEVCLCIVCGNRRAVSDTDLRTAGCAVCRLCQATPDASPKIQLRLTQMADALKIQGLDREVRLVVGYCPTGHLHALVENPLAEGQANPPLSVLDVCQAIPDVERSEQVRWFIKRYALGNRAASQLSAWADPTADMPL